MSRYRWYKVRLQSQLAVTCILPIGHIDMSYLSYLSKVSSYENRQFEHFGVFTIWHASCSNNNYDKS
jgi:hypothetical protein